MTPSQPEPLAESGLTWLAVLAVGVLFVMIAGDVQHVRQHPAAARRVLLGLGVLVGLLVRDARRLDARRGRMLRISAIWAPVVGAGALLASVPLINYLDNNGRRCRSAARRSGAR